MVRFVSGELRMTAGADSMENLLLREYDVPRGEGHELHDVREIVMVGQRIVELSGQIPRQFPSRRQGRRTSAGAQKGRAFPLADAVGQGLPLEVG